jgi:hypothetical protein
VIRETTAALERVTLHVHVPGDRGPRIRRLVVTRTAAIRAALDL